MVVLSVVPRGLIARVLCVSVRVPNLIRSPWCDGSMVVLLRIAAWFDRSSVYGSVRVPNLIRSPVVCSWSDGGSLGVQLYPWPGELSRGVMLECLCLGTGAQSDT